MMRTISGAPRSALEGVLVPGREVEIPCKYVLHDVKKDSDNVRQTLQEVQKSR